MRNLNGCGAAQCENNVLTMDEECELEPFGQLPIYCNNCKFKSDYDCRYEFNSTVTKNCKCWAKLTEIRRG